MVVGGISDFDPERATEPIPLSSVTDVAFVDVQVKVTEVPMITFCGCAVTVNVGGPDGVGGLGVGLLLEVVPRTPWQDVAR